MVYRAEPVTQRDGSSLENSNCRYASIATGIDFDTQGTITSTGKKMRDYSNDPSGGSWAEDGVRAWRNGYEMQLYVDDGEPFDNAIDLLHDGRLVHLEVWSATCGGPCCTSACGHVMAIAPESRQNNGEWEWLVADPWCKPPKWVWWRQSKLKAGAEEWADRCGFRSAQGGGPRDIRDLHPEARARIVKELMTLWTPDRPLRPADDNYEPSVWLGAQGGAPILFTHTGPSNKESYNVAINANGSALASKRRVTLTADAGFYEDAGLTKKYGTLSAGTDRVFIGPALGTNSYAILVHTSKPYDDGTDRDTVVYVTKDKCSDPFTVETPPDDDTAARDAQWREWLDTDSGAPDRE